MMILTIGNLDGRREMISYFPYDDDDDDGVAFILFSSSEVRPNKKVDEKLTRWGASNARHADTMM